MSANTRTARPENMPRPGEIPLKVWVAKIAQATGMTERAVHARFNRGKLKPKGLRRVNARVIYVQA